MSEVKFPTMVYKSPGRHKAGHGKTYDYKGIANEKELENALSIGWCLTVNDAVYGKKTAEVKKAEAEAEEKELRQKLEAEAERRGLERGKHYDGRTPTQKLSEMLFGKKEE